MPVRRLDHQGAGATSIERLDEVSSEALIGLALAQHAAFRETLPRLIGLAREVEATTPDRADAPRGIADLLAELAASQEEHMLREEYCIFPLMQDGPSPRLSAGIAVMSAEHDDNIQFLMRMAQLSGGYRAPAGASEIWVALCIGLERLADDLVAHIYAEERVLFPRYAQQA
ncbi:hemerythrin domain-containing protein [Amaricoccus sp.]|uniref:hemerythrin domain-containing protein n=1 Tax=Amaricoccus sp. TaxID=1872485 RepID=UPI001B5DFEC4|nr:hemerythrin domain-containing protein [Amaricoccus sp.]MBP7241809.1 hemerythrin domain-containing protein [Amaricoccus sp.]